MYAIVSGPRNRTIASYSSDTEQLDFIKRTDEVFAQTIHNGMAVEYPVDPSFLDIQDVPTDLCQSNGKTIRWLLNHGYQPILEEDVIVFNPFPVDKNDLKMGREQEVDSATFFPGLQNRIALHQSDYEDLEGHYFKCLKQAKEQGYIEEQVFYLLKISNLYIQKGNFLVGAKLINSAIAISSKNSEIEQILFKQLATIENLFLKAQGLKPLPETSIKKHRYSLLSCRSVADKAEKPIEENLHNLTAEFKKILSTFIVEAMGVMGPAPVKWACIGMGSMARDEMCPYSDVEFAFLIERESLKAKEYFRKLTKILELKIINLGETEFSVFGWEYDSPTPNGFCMDSGGNTPLGIANLYELIGTPSQLAQFQTFQWIEGNIILPNVMSHVCYVAGDSQLVAAYKVHKERVQQTDIRTKQGPSKNGTELAMRLLAGHLREFHPDLSKQKEGEARFNVKIELYRPFQEILSSLAILYQLKAKTTFERINELKEMGIFSSKGAENLKLIINKVLSLRLKTHLFYKNETELLFHPEHDKPKIFGIICGAGITGHDPTTTPQLYLDKEHIDILYEIYQVLFPFHKCVSHFYQTRDEKKLRNSNFFDDSPLVRGQAFEKVFQYEEAEEAYHDSVSLNPNDVEALLQLAEIENKQGKCQEALARCEKAIAITQQKYQDIHPDLAKCYMGIASVYSHLSRYDERLEYEKKALTVRLTLLNRSQGYVGPNTNDLEIASNYNNIGCAYLLLEKYDEARQSFEEALCIWVKHLGKDDPDVALAYNNIGTAWSDMGEFSKALELYEKALEIRKRVFGENHPCTSDSYDFIGNTHYCLGNYGKSLEYAKLCLNIRLKTLGKMHPKIAKSYDAIGEMYTALQKWQKGLFYFKNALKIYQKIWGEDHLEVANSYSSIGRLYQQKGSFEQALECYEKALKIRQNVWGEQKHLDIAKSYIDMSSINRDLREFKKALRYSKDALAIRIHLLGKNHPTVAASHNNIGDIYCELDKDEKALKKYQTALKIQRDALGEKNSNVAATYMGIAQVYYGHKDYQLALANAEKCLEIQQLVFGADHLDLAYTDHFIADIYISLKQPKKALEYDKKALQIHLKILGHNSLSVAKSYNAVAYKYYCLNRHKKAADFYNSALKIRLRILDKMHLDIAENYRDLGAVYNNLADAKQSLLYYKKALEIYESHADSNHVNLVEIYTDISAACKDLGKFKESLENTKKALQILLSMEKGDQLEIAKCYSNMGVLYTDLKKHDRALKCFQKALVIHLEERGENHFLIAHDHRCLGMTYIDFQKYEEAIPYFDKTLELLNQLGDGYELDICDCYDNMAVIYGNLHEFEQALQFSRQALEIKLKFLEPDDARILANYVNISFFLTALGDLDAAATYRNKATYMAARSLHEIQDSDADIGCCTSLLVACLLNWCISYTNEDEETKPLIQSGTF